MSVLIIFVNLKILKNIFGDVCNFALSDLIVVHVQGFMCGSIAPSAGNLLTLQ